MQFLLFSRVVTAGLDSGLFLSSLLSLLEGLLARNYENVSKSSQTSRMAATSRHGSLCREIVGILVQVAAEPSALEEREQR